MRKKIKQHKKRNFAALSPLMSKGGSHQKSASSRRRKQKNKLRKELDRLAKQGDFFMYQLKTGIPSLYNCLVLRKNTENYEL